MRAVLPRRERLQTGSGWECGASLGGEDELMHGGGRRLFLGRLIRLDLCDNFKDIMHK